MREIEEDREVNAVEILKEEQWWGRKNKGVGSLCLCSKDVDVILYLHHLNPARSNNSYVANLFRLTGAIVSSTFISEFFKNIGPFKGNLRSMNKVPVEKYRLNNILTYNDYLHYISNIPPR